MRNMTARAEAVAAGDKQYTTGIPCKQGHTAPRATKTGTCVECTRLAAQQWAKDNRPRMSAYVAEYRDRNRELVRARDLAAHKAKRHADPSGVRKQSVMRYAAKAAAQGRAVRPLNRTPIAELVARLENVHGTAVQYLGGYSTMTAKAQFRCTQHLLDFDAQPHNVLRGAVACPRCGHMQSAEELRIAEYVAVFTRVVSRDRTLLRPKELDVLLPDARLAIEYSGMYWHSHFNAEDSRKDKHKHFEKYQECADKGVRLLTIYEAEWQQREPAIRRLLRNALGRGRGKLMARKCVLQKVPTPEARLFYEKYHPQGGEGGGEHYGLYWRGKLVSCMRFALGVNDRGAARGRVWTLGRYATRVTVAGGASRLFSAFIAEHAPTAVKSFSDNRYFAGDMYTQLGFVLETVLAPDYQIWSPKLGLQPKAFYQRRNIPKRLLEHGVDAVFDPATDRRSEADMTYLMGCGRIYDCGKKRWVWTAHTAS